MYKERISTLAVASMATGILSMVLFPFYRVAVPLVVVITLLGIGAIVTGVFAIRRAAIYPLRGRVFANIGIITGANGLFWMWVDFIFRMMR